MNDKLSYEPHLRVQTDEETREWTDRMTELVWGHVDAETGATDLDGYMDECNLYGLNPTVDQAERYLDYASESVRGASND